MSSGALWGAMTSWLTPMVLFCVLNLVVATIYITSSFKNQRNQEQQLKRTQSLQVREVEDDDVVQLFRVPSLLERVRSISFSRRHADEQPSNPSPAEMTQYVEPSEQEEKRTKGGEEVDDDEHDHGARSDSLTSPSPVEGPVQLFRVPSLLERVRSISFSRRHAEPPPNPSPADPSQQEAAAKEEDVDDDDDDDDGGDHGARARSESLTPPSLEEAPARKAKQSKMKKSESARIAAVKVDEERVERQRPATVREKKTKWDETATSDAEDEAVDAKADAFINRFRQQLKLQRIDSILRSRGLAR